MNLFVGFKEKRNSRVEFNEMTMAIHVAKSKTTHYTSIREITDSESVGSSDRYRASTQTENRQADRQTRDLDRTTYQ